MKHVAFWHNLHYMLIQILAHIETRFKSDEHEFTSKGIWIYNKKISIAPFHKPTFTNLTEFSTTKKKLYLERFLWYSEV